MTTPRISIAMATYNGERFLQEQLDSLARQTLLPYELVVCDDGSTDATVSILEAFASSTPFPVRIYRNEENLGYGDNFLKAARLCKGDWIAFCDQDDVWLEHKLARCAEVLAKYPEVDLLSHSAIQVDARLRTLKYRVPNHREFEIRGPLTNPPLRALLGSSCLVRKAMLDGVPHENRPADRKHPERRQSHDRFVFHVSNTFGSVAYYPNPLMMYRRHDATVTGAVGSGQYNRGVIYRLKVFAYANYAYMASLSREARQHSIYYKKVADALHEGKGSGSVENALNAAGLYLTLARLFDNRSIIYDAHSNFKSRSAALYRSIAAGRLEYAHLDKRLGLLSILRDAVGVIVGK